MSYCLYVELTDKSAIHWFSAEMLVAYQFCKCGYVVGVPLSPCEYDLMIDTKKGIVRVQVKKALFREQRLRPQGLGDRAHWEVHLTRRGHRMANGDRQHKRISDEEFDYLAVVCQEDAIYIIPKDKLKSQDDGLLLRLFHIKAPVESLDGRADSIKAGLRWEAYKNKFCMNGENYEQEAIG